MKIWKCKRCGNIVTVLKEGTCIPKCCGEEMIELVANTEDAAVEKHVPIVTLNKDKVEIKCGEVPHPMEEKHYIEFLMIETSKGIHIHNLNPQEKPETEFRLSENEIFISAYAYCNLHGLWKNKTK